jgi:Tol biopolymer transport system component
MVGNMLKAKYLKLCASFTLLIVTLYLGLTATPTLHAQINCAAPTQLSNGLSEYLYDIDHDLAVWVEDSDGDGEIWMYDLATQTKTRLTDNNSYEDGFAVKNGVIVLSVQTTNGYEVFLYNSATRSSTQITNNTVEEMDLYTDGASVVWLAEDGNDNELYHYNIQTGVTIRITNNNYDDYSPVVSGEYVLWTRYNGYDAEVFLYHFVTGKIEQISDSPYGDSSLQDVDDTNVVWTNFDGEDTEIYYYNLLTREVRQLTDNSVDDESPVVDGGYIAWQYFDGTDSEIMLYDIQNALSIPLTNNALSDWNPSIHGDTIVWEGDDGSDYEVFSHDLSDHTDTTITTQNEWDSKPIVHNRMVLWQSGVFFDPVQGDVAELYFSDCRNDNTPVTLTVEPTIEATSTTEPTSTDEPTIEPTATDETTATVEPTTPAELLLNTGFEELDSKAWKVKNQSRDKLRCNKPEKTVAFAGNCAFRFRGNSDENSKLLQKVDLNGKVFSIGDTLTLSLQINAPNASSAVIKLRVTYGDGTAPGKISEVLGTTGGYTEIRYPYTVASTNVSKIKVMFINTSLLGRLYVDDFSLKHSAGSATTIGLIPLP